MTSYIEIEKLFGTPLNQISTSRPTLSGGQIIIVILVSGLAIYGGYKLLQACAAPEDKPTIKVPPAPVKKS